MQREGDDDAWRAIVENFGERASLDDESPEDRQPEQRDAPRPDARTDRSDPYAWAVADEPDEPRELAERPSLPDDEDTYVPPEPPPLPIPEPDRGIAWIGVVGAPALLLLSLVTGIGLPTWVGYLMVAWFVGGFCYLVARMPKEPRDPWDDGSRV